MKRKFKIGDRVRVVKAGRGYPPEALLTEGVIVADTLEYPMGRENGYLMCDNEGNVDFNNPYNCVGESSFELIDGPANELNPEEFISEKGYALHTRNGYMNADKGNLVEWAISKESTKESLEVLIALCLHMLKEGMYADK